MVQVLVVEDEALSAMMIEDALNDAGHTVRGPASTTSGALMLAELSPPDLALINLHLDGRNGRGIELARELRKRWGTPSLFVSEQVTQAMSCRDAAMGVVGKPYDSETIVACVEIAALVKQGKEVPCGLIPKRFALFR